MGEILVSVAIGGCLVVSGIMMNIHLKHEEDRIGKE